jgi:hypothetical protein
MTKIIERTFNLETGKTVDSERAMTAEEIVQVEEAQSLAAQRQASRQANEAARQAVLTKLGLTAEEAQALLG